MTLSQSPPATAAPAYPGSADDTAVLAPVPAEPAPRHGSDFRGDIAGLRAVAVGLVLLYHAGLPFLPGGFVGVDVFFVISGFLITGQLLNEVDRTGRVSLAGFYARRAKRILPAAAVVLMAVAVAGRLLLPRSVWEDTGGDIVAAATYILNWRLADRAVDYLAGDSAASAVQHFWSLAVEEQFYIVWPLLIIVALLAARVLRRVPARVLISVGLTVGALASLAWSIHYTAGSPQRAFFVSTTRMWELALGAGLALAAARTARLPRKLALVLGWAGLAAVTAAAVLITENTPWPGYAAALPTLGAGAVIAAGAAAGRGGPVALLGTRPFRWVGELSYSLYLWHWPMLVIATAYWDGLSVQRGLLVAAASVVPAWLTYRLVENPMRYARSVSRSPRLALSLGGNMTLAGICAGLVLAMSGVFAAGAADTPRNPIGAGVLPQTGITERNIKMQESFAYIYPDPLKAANDAPDSASVCFQEADPAEIIWCTYGNPQGRTKVALVGDSKMDQWLPAFQAIAAQNDWQVDIAFKAACPFTTAPALSGGDAAKPYTSCTQWNATLLRELEQRRYAYVFTSSGTAKAAAADGTASAQALADGMREAWTRLDGVGTKVVVVANNPSPTVKMIDCVDRNRSKLSACSFDWQRHAQDEAFRTQQLALSAAPKVKLVDLFDFICPTLRCPAVVGNAMVYRSGSHVTATYVKTLTPFLADALRKAGVPVTYAAAASGG
ncbi:acyltransferase family protein [Catellatospora sp. KI3]|uniref:acyltransferase family protein n=1 Tax=Catellatospora sp. KI3 TaxID=3041620 RepID=UPI002482C086|nr:acyltransferase family protein [Catellatospora sp. KI3]MDI1465296.1 acyltransferase family protein [Catellatospora sp. KI3]